MICGTESEEKNIDFGPIQGSTLGPILFLVYINNLPQLQISGKLFLFADDCAVLFVGKNWDSVVNQAQQDLSLIKTWLDQNILTLNIAKTKVMPISLSNRTDPNFNGIYLHTCGNPSNRTCNCDKIELVDKFKYLGVVLDKRMNWSEHVTYLKIIVRLIGFKMLNGILNLVELKQAYFAYCQSLFLYGLIGLGGAGKTILEPLNVTQKSVIKAALGLGRRHPSEELYNTFNVLNIRQLYIKTLLLYVKKNHLIIFTPIHHGYETRHSRSVGIQTQQIYKTFSTTTPFHVAHFLFRNVPHYLKTSFNCSDFVFKKRVHNWLVELGRDLAERVIAPGYR